MKTIKAQEKPSAWDPDLYKDLPESRRDLERSYEGSYKHYMTPDDWNPKPEEWKARDKAARSMLMQLLSDLESIFSRMAINEKDLRKA